MVRRLAVTSSPISPSPRVAPCSKAPSLVDQLHRQPVQLRLADVVERLGAQRLADALVELEQLLVGEGRWPSESIGLPVGRPSRTSRRRAGHPLGGRVRGARSGCSRLERLQLPHQPVVLGVGRPPGRRGRSSGGRGGRSLPATPSLGWPDQWIPRDGTRWWEGRGPCSVLTGVGTLNKLILLSRSLGVFLLVRPLPSAKSHS